MGYRLNFGDVIGYSSLLAWGAWYTIQLTALSTVLGLLVGTLGALARNSRHRPLRLFSAAYVEFIRNTPFLIQLFFIFFGLPSLGLRLTAGEAALLTMVVNLGAYATEIIRAGIEAIHRGQVEAGLSLGMTRWQVFRHIIFLPALEKIYPALASQLVFSMLGSSIVSQISAEDLTFAANFIQSRNFRSFETYFIITAVYLAMAVGFRNLLDRIGARVFVWRRP
ncbi:MAG TPA: amino acid ABC transporter permease [Candidatus Sulfotelmatobacter sp.]|nr:amino acid ABC transporter permease [Candidatus Sulfotelmatobacter sp.]